MHWGRKSCGKRNGDISEKSSAPKSGERDVPAGQKRPAVRQRIETLATASKSSIGDSTPAVSLRSAPPLKPRSRQLPANRRLATGVHLKPSVETMKTILIAALALVGAGTALAQDQSNVPAAWRQPMPAPGALNNMDVVAMTLTHLSDDVIVAKINSSPCVFDTDVPSLNELRKNGVGSQVLLAMINRPKSFERQTDSPVRESPDGRIRIFVTDSQSWEMRGGAFGQGSGAAAWGHSGGVARSSFSSGAYSSGGARPQTMEIVKTFGERCPDLVVTNRPDNANYVVTLDHEGGKALLSRHNKIGVFNRQGDVIFSHSTITLGDSVRDACDSIRRDISTGGRS